MKVLIVEDETAAYENLCEILAKVAPDIEVVENVESVTQTVRWLQNNPAPELIFMDIHLSDGSAFAIFEEIQVSVPIVFTTAYDKYAIEAFKVNSVDYLLKPIKEAEVKRALDKYRRLSGPDLLQYLSNITQLIPARKYSDKILIPYKDRLVPVNMSDISFFYTSDRNTFVYLKDGTKYAYSKTLDQIMPLLNPQDFIRANKQYIVNRNSVTNITVWFDSRLLVSVDVEAPERIYVSKNKASEFKAWMVSV